MDAGAAKGRMKRVFDGGQGGNANFSEIVANATVKFSANAESEIKFAREGKFS